MAYCIKSHLNALWLDVYRKKFICFDVFAILMMPFDVEGEASGGLMVWCQAT